MLVGGGSPTRRSGARRQPASHPPSSRGAGHGSRVSHRGGSVSAGDRGHGAARPVVLYHTTVRTHADARGQVTQAIHLAYYPARTIQAMLVVTVRTPLGASTRRTRITITPVHHRFR